MYTAIDIAKYTVDLCVCMGNAINEQRLQKILYYVQLAFVNKCGHVAFHDDFEACDNGPIVKSVQEYFSTYGPIEICRFFPECRCLFFLADEDRHLVNTVIARCLYIDIWDLIELSKNELWQKTYADGAGRNHVIPKDDIIAYAKD